jgi:hypothetical protein
MLPWLATLAGRIDEHDLDSAALRGNPLGDPSQRPLWVYVPPGYDDEPERRYPGSPGMSVGQSGARSCGRWSSIGPQDSMTRASAAFGEWKP